MTRMPGVAALTVELNGTVRMDVLRQLGRTLRRIHSIPQEPFFKNSLFLGSRNREQFNELVQAG